MDETEGIRRFLVEALNAGLPQEEAEAKAQLQVQYGEDVWDTKEMSERFEAIGFMAPYVVVRRRSDSKKGTLMFTHSPRFYFSWQEA